MLTTDVALVEDVWSHTVGIFAASFALPMLVGVGLCFLDLRLGLILLAALPAALLVLAATTPIFVRATESVLEATADVSGRVVETAPDPPSMHPRRAQWADLMRHAFGYDLLWCPRCGGKMKLLACILDRESIRKILTHRGLRAEPPPRADGGGVW